ncbi:MAG: leucine--tRNA ligase [Bacteroidota bacterium]
MEYDFRAIEKKWQKIWQEQGTYRVEPDPEKPKCYVLYMFPYPSGAGLHVGHPLGYIASDIYARYKRLKGFNVLHPMGYDAFGLPAEQYAIQTGQHPAVTTEQNIKRYREQLDNIGFCYDWSREVRTCDPTYYRWTQWIFLQLFDSWYDPELQKARPITTLINRFELQGFSGSDDSLLTGDMEHSIASFSATDWNRFSEKEKSDILMNFRLAYLGDAWVNWCPALGTVLANDEVKDGVSERGGHTVERKQMRQWSMRITAYAQRLLDDLEIIQWSDSIKEHQRNWIGRSEGCSVFFNVEGSKQTIEVFTTRPDTLFGVSFVTLAPEHPLVDELTTSDCRAAVTAYVDTAKNKTERERQASKTVSGCFTGAYVLHPFSGRKVPVWVGEYVLAGYGTGAVMAVPAHDARDHAFASKFDLPILQVVQAPDGWDIQRESWDAKEGVCVHSEFLNGLTVPQAITKMVSEVESRGFGKGKINFRLRDAAFGRQRYWGEPIPIFYKDGVPCALPDSRLPLVLPEIDKFLPTETGEPPLARATGWEYEGHPLETTTMPGWAGSSWYFLRYMDPANQAAFASSEAVNYWGDVDLYIGGSEHATGHLLYVRFWTKVLFDLGHIPVKEPAYRLVNQGMIQGRSNFVYRDKSSGKFISSNLKDGHDTMALHVDVNIVDSDVLDIEKFRAWRSEYAQAEFELEDGKYICGSEVEKMSKSKWNVVNPDDMIERYGADCFRLYEMFLGPIELSKPWNTSGITGTSGFLRKFWRLYHQGGAFQVTDQSAGKQELKALHKLIKRIQDDMERLSFNTSVSAFMICVNELTDLKCTSRQVLEPLVVLLAPFAPHLAEEVWHAMGHRTSVTRADFPVLKEEYLVEQAFAYPISVNGKTKLNLELALTLSKEQVEEEVLKADEVLRLLDGKPPKKVVVVPGRIVNIVV